MTKDVYLFGTYIGNVENEENFEIQADYMSLDSFKPAQWFREVVSTSQIDNDPGRYSKIIIFPGQLRAYVRKSHTDRGYLTSFENFLDQF